MIIIAVPPSANAMYTRTKHRHQAKSHKYKSWLDAYAVAVKERFGVRLPEKTPLAVSVVAHMSRKRDLDNIIKPILDLLQYADVIADDRYVDNISMQRVDKSYSYWLTKDTIQIDISTL